MKIRFTCDTGASTQSAIQSGWLDVEECTGFTPEEWNALDGTQLNDIAIAWAFENGLGIYIEEKE